MQSKFKFSSFFPVITSVMLLFVLSFYISLLFDSNKQKLPLNGIPLLLLLLFTLTWLVFGEIRTKMIKVFIDTDCIIVKRFGGLQKKKKYLFSEFDGYEISYLTSGGGDVNEYLYLLKKNKKVVKLSTFYQKNYFELKKIIQSHVLNLGLKRFSFFEELKEVFS